MKSVMEKDKPETLSSLASDLRGGTLTVQSYIETLQDRFSRMEHEVNAFVPEEDRFARLKREAKALEETYPDVASRPPLFGVPVGVKDIIHCAGFATQAGSRLPADALKGPEADAVRALKRAGALILGKTRTTEFAYFSPGPTRNPHNLDHTPGGSSSGSAAATACGLCPLALGTQTIGSVIRPASFCGVAGFKPTYDRISLKGVIPLSPSVDHVGFFCRDVEGAALAASVLCRDWRGTANAASPIVLGVPEGPYLGMTSPEGLEHFKRALFRLAEAGYEIRSVDVMPDFDRIVAMHKQIVAAEAAVVHLEWFLKHSDLYSAEMTELIELGKRVSTEELMIGKQNRLNLRKSLKETMDAKGITAWIAPSSVGPAPPGIEATGDPIMNLPWTHAGLPVIGLPAGLTESGLPMGVQLIGDWMQDEEVLDTARRLAPVLE